MRCPAHHPNGSAVAGHRAAGSAGDSADALLETAHVVAWAIWAALHGTVDLTITDEHRHWPDRERHLQLILALVDAAAD